jgi:hypothetical protein
MLVSKRREYVRRAERGAGTIHGAHPPGAEMQRDCTRCRRPFTLAELSREETQNLEAQRKATGLEGVKFLYFHCPACGMDDIFVAILPLATEFAEDYEARREAMEKVVRGLHVDNVAAVVVPLKAP